MTADQREQTTGGGMWDDGLIARRAGEGEAPVIRRGRPRAMPPADTDPWAAAQDWEFLYEEAPADASGLPAPSVPGDDGQPPASRAPEQRPGEPVLRARLEALRELVGLSRTRLDGRTLAEAGRVLDEAAARRRLSLDHTVVAIAGATGSGKSSLFNAIAGATLAEVGPRRPTTAQAGACAWREPGDDVPNQLLERIGLPPRAARPQRDDLGLRGLVLLDLPDFDSTMVQHREEVEWLLARVDAVIWVTDPEKYADAMLHERYLQPLAGYAEVAFVLLNQVDRLPGDAADQVLDDLRRLLDEDGLALGEHGEPGATVLAVSAQTGEGVQELRSELARLVTERQAAERRLGADVDGAVARLREVFFADGSGPAGLGGQTRETFEDRLADAVGAGAAGRAAERLWLREAADACGSRWARLWERARVMEHYADWQAKRRQSDESRTATRTRPPRRTPPAAVPAGPVTASRPVVEQAVRSVSAEAGSGLPAPWSQAVHEAAVRGAQGLSDALDAKTAAVGPAQPGRPRWWSVVGATQSALFMVQLLCLLWLFGALTGMAHLAWQLLLGFALVCAGSGPLVAVVCRLAARGPARRHGQETERALREAAAGCGRAMVLEPIASELLRYGEVREQYVAAAGGASAL